MHSKTVSNIKILRTKGEEDKKRTTTENVLKIRETKNKCWK